MRDDVQASRLVRRLVFEPIGVLVLLSLSQVRSLLLRPLLLPGSMYCPINILKPGSRLGVTILPSVATAHLREISEVKSPPKACVQSS